MPDTPEIKLPRFESKAWKELVVKAVATHPGKRTPKQQAALDLMKAKGLFV